MRVTKVIREYIENRVEERYPMPKKVKSCAQVALDELQERCRAFIKAEAEKYATVYVEDFERVRWRGSGDCNEQKIKSFVENCSANVCYPTFKAEDEYNKAVENVHNKRAKAVREIVIELELGASKADLEALLANLPD